MRCQVIQHELPLHMFARELHESLRRYRQLLADRIHKIPVALQRKAFDVERDEALLLDLRAERMARHDGHAEAGGDGLLDRLVGRELHSDPRLQAVLGEDFLSSLARAGTALAHQERFLCQPLERNA